MSSNNKKHIHKYYKSYNPANGQFLWTCGLGDCGHHMPKHYEHTLNGKSSVCWGHNQDCKKFVTLDERAMAMDKPLCEECDPKTFNLQTTDDDVIEALKKITVLGKLE